jgi:hypothetical protein
MLLDSNLAVSITGEDRVHVDEGGAQHHVVYLNPEEGD